VKGAINFTKQDFCI